MPRKNLLKSTLITPLITLLICVFSTSLLAQKTTPTINNASINTALAGIPILHDGRIKPLDSFARAQLKRLSGHDKNALNWLTEALFNPALSEQRRVLKIRSPAVINLLNLENRKGRTYSHKEITRALSTKQDLVLSTLKTPEAQWTPAQKNLIALQQNTVTLSDILSSLSVFLPLSMDVQNQYTLAADAQTPPSYMSLLTVQKNIEDEVKKIIKNKGMDIESYTKSEQNITRLSYALSNLRRQGARSDILRVLPPYDDEQNFHAPWAYVLSGQSHPANKTLFSSWNTLARAYHSGDGAAFIAAAQTIKSNTISRASLNETKINAEVLYNRTAPFALSCTLYGIAAFALMIGGIFWTRRRGALSRLAASALTAGLAVHIIGIGARVYILSRPPVSTLYESILFVGAVGVAYTLHAHIKNRQDIWLYVGAISGIILHILGFAHDQDGDSFLMLTAVLNTNFWLATHVTVITAGYAFCILTSLLAHTCLLQIFTARTGKPSKALWDKTWVCALLALLLTSVGTILGGIWADQSWGRFWGWDPKENGALLIVLWLIWVIHGKIAGQFNHIWTAAGLAYLSVIVALSWFGVNLLSVGLHAYGFTDSAAWTLGIFTAAETIFIGGLLLFIYKRSYHAV